MESPWGKKTSWYETQLHLIVFSTISRILGVWVYSLCINWMNWKVKNVLTRRSFFEKSLRSCNECLQAATGETLFQELSQALVKPGDSIQPLQLGSKSTERLRICLLLNFEQKKFSITELFLLLVFPPWSTLSGSRNISCAHESPVHAHLKH